MRVVFMGTPEFAVPSLQALARVHDVVGVLTRPDMPGRRRGEAVPGPVRIAAETLDIPVSQPRTLRDAETLAALAALAPDVIVVAAYGLILPSDVLAVPPLGCINVHASVLPRWRGAAPIQRAILEGDELTGVSIMRMEEGLDTGPVARVSTMSVGAHTTASLTAGLAQIGATALLEVLMQLEAGTVRWVPQPEGATYANKVTAEDVVLGPDKDVETLLRRVRAATSSAPSRAVIGDVPVVILDAEPAAVARRAAGSVSPDKAGLVLHAADGPLLVSHLIPAGRKAMDGASFARGARLTDTTTWSTP